MSNNDSYLTKLRKFLLQYFNFEELKTICFDLGFDFDSLPGDGSAAKIRELLILVARQGRLESLLSRVREERPNIPWPPVPEDYDFSSTVEFSDSEDKNKPSFNFGDVKASIVNIGGEQTLSGAVHVDMRDHHDDINNSKTKNESLNIFFEQIKNKIQHLPVANEDQKSTLNVMVNNFKNSLVITQSDDVKSVQKFLKRFEKLIQELLESEPDKEMVEIIGESFIRSAKDAENSLPNATENARIISTILYSCIS